MGLFDDIFGTGGGGSGVPDFIARFGRDNVNAISDFLFPGGPGIGGFQPYTPYPDQRVADLTDEERAAIDLAGQSAGQFAPLADLAREAVTRGLDQAGQGMTDFYDLIEEGTTFRPSRIDDYVDPYRSGVVDEIFRRSNENLLENVLPGVSDVFTSAGQFGSSRHADFTNRAIRDSQREATGAAAGVLSDAYGDAVDAYGLDRRRLLEGAGTLADGSNALVNALFGGGATAMDIGLGAANMHNQDIMNLLTVGALERGIDQDRIDTDYGDFLEFRDWPITRVGQAMQAVSGGPIQLFGRPSNPATPSPLQQIAGLGITGLGLGRMGGLFN